MVKKCIFELSKKKCIFLSIIILLSGVVVSTFKVNFISSASPNKNPLLRTEINDHNTINGKSQKNHNTISTNNSGLPDWANVWKDQTASFGWEGDLNAPISFVNGNYDLRSRGNNDDSSLHINFGVSNSDIMGKISWVNSEGYLPCFIHKYTVSDASIQRQANIMQTTNPAPLLEITIMNFADLAIINNHKFEITYSKFIVKNISQNITHLPSPSDELIQLTNNTSTTINPNQVITRDYAIASDRFWVKNTPSWPSDLEIKDTGTFDEHYEHMKNYWNNRLKGIINVNVPDSDMINALKAGYIYMMIMKDDIYKPASGRIEKYLRVGENGYDNTLWESDTMGMIAYLLTVGDNFISGSDIYLRDYLDTLPDDNIKNYKLSFPFAMYLQKTNDLEYLTSKFDALKTVTHAIHDARMGENHDGIIKEGSIDSAGYWLLDDWTALTGLQSYKYISTKLGEHNEVFWAENEYNSLYKAIDEQLKSLTDTYNLNYLPFSLTWSNTDPANPRHDPHDANWSSALTAGNWGWSGYLFDSPYYGHQNDWIDRTYENTWKERSSFSDSNYNFGGFVPSQVSYSSAYNAGYGSAALRGEKYRDTGIKALNFMINNTSSGPYSWWEGELSQDDSAPYGNDGKKHSASGGGSCQHMWGQAVATQVFTESLISEKYNNSVIIGRGLPNDWITSGKEISIHNYIANQKRTGYKMQYINNSIVIDWDDNMPNAYIEPMLLKNNVSNITGGYIQDREKGYIFVPKNTKQTVIWLGNVNKNTLSKLIKNCNKKYYSSKSFSYIRKAYNSAVSVLNNNNASQTEINNTYSNLQRLTKKLKVKIKSINAYKRTYSVKYNKKTKIYIKVSFYKSPIVKSYGYLSFNHLQKNSHFSLIGNKQKIKLSSKFGKLGSLTKKKIYFIVKGKKYRSGNIYVVINDKVKKLKFKVN